MSKVAKSSTRGKSKKRTARPAPRERGTGELIRRPSGWYYGRAYLVIDGIPTRVMRALRTRDRDEANRRLNRMIDENAAERAVIERIETVAEAAERVWTDRQASGHYDERSAHESLERLKRHALKVIGSMPVTKVRRADVYRVLKRCRRKGLGLSSTKHVRQDLRAIFNECEAEGVITVNPCDKVKMPRFSEEKREQAQLTDFQLGVYLAYEHPQKKWRTSVLERQIMAVVSRMFGGLRTSDLHRLRWEQLDAAGGRFRQGWAPSKKTKTRRKLPIPDRLRPFLIRWWDENDRPAKGLVFPVRVGARAGQEKVKSTHARSFRRDVEASFKAAIKAGIEHAELPEPDSEEWRELFEGTENVRPLNFHSFRHAFTQACHEAGLSVAEVMALTGHRSIDAHKEYMGLGKPRSVVLPDAALPALPEIATADTNGITPTGYGRGSGHFTTSRPSGKHAQGARMIHLEQQRSVPDGIWELDVGGSNPLAPTRVFGGDPPELSHRVIPLAGENGGAGPFRATVYAESLADLERLADLTREHLRGRVEVVIETDTDSQEVG